MFEWTKACMQYALSKIWYVENMDGGVDSVPSLSADHQLIYRCQPRGTQFY